MHRPRTQQVSTWRRSLWQGLRALLWLWRWIILVIAWIFIGLPGIFILQISLARGIAWITPVVGCVLLVALILIGVRREGRRSRPIPPRPPGQGSDEPIQAAEIAPLNLRGRQAA